jgi:fructokinase
VDYLEASGVRLVPGSTTANRTPTALARLDESGAADYVFDLEWELAGTAEVAPPIIAHTGSIAGFLTPGCLATAALLDAYRPSATITYDPNVRPDLITDRDQAIERIDRLVERADVVKASDEDLLWIAPDSDPERTAQTWLASGPSIVAVTMGARGAFALCAAGTVRVAARPVQVVDTVGAGDSFMTGLIDALWSLDLLGAPRRGDLARIGTDTLDGVIRAASLASALTVAKAGADLPDREALQRG